MNLIVVPSLSYFFIVLPKQSEADFEVRVSPFQGSNNPHFRSLPIIEPQFLLSQQRSVSQSPTVPQTQMIIEPSKHPGPDSRHLARLFSLLGTPKGELGVILAHPAAHTASMLVEAPFYPYR